MKNAGYRSQNRYKDNLAQKKRRRFFIWTSLFACVVVGLVIGSVYLFFYSSVMRITNISVNGLKTADTEQVYRLIESKLNRNALNISTLKPQKNIIFFDTEALKRETLDNFTVLKSLEIKKEYFHKIILNFSERIAIGSWCLPDTCYNFDDEGILWGKTAKSSGSLLLVIEDFRTNIEERKRVGTIFLESINKALVGVEQLKLKVKKIEIPADSIGDYKMHLTDEYYLLLDANSDIEKQLESLRVFLKNKGPDFKPQYIDIRIEGRVYYK